MTLNPTSFRYPVNIHGKADPDVVDAINYHDDAITDLQQAIPSLKAQIDAKASTSSTASTSSASTITEPQVANIAQVEALAQISSTFGKVNSQTATAYTPQQSDYAGLITLNNASATSITLDGSTLPTQWFSSMENLGPGTATLTPATGTITYPANIGASSMPLAAGNSVFLYFDGTDWWGLPVGAAGGGSGVTSLQGETGAITLTSSGATVVITTPTSSTINLESTAGNPFNNSGTAPTIVLHGPAGSGATATVQGNGVFGTIILIAGSGASAGFIATITIPTAFPTTTAPFASGFVQATSVGFSFAAFAAGTNIWELNAGAAMASGTAYVITYLVFGN